MRGGSVRLDSEFVFVCSVFRRVLGSRLPWVGVGFLEGRDFYRFTPIHMGGYFYHFTRILRTYFYHFTHQAQISLRALRALCTPLHSSLSKL